MTDDKRNPPAGHQGAPTDNDMVSARHRQRADLALRIASLRVTGHQMFEIDPSGMLSAQLFDLADLLEVLDRDGRVIWR